MTIPTSIADTILENEKKNKKNVLLLAMSTFPKGKVTENTFSVEGAAYSIENCIGQLEPIVKLRLRENPLNIPLKIIVLCTKDVKEEKKTFTVGSVTVEDETAIQFFKDRVGGFAREAGTEIEIVERDLDEANPNGGIQEAVKDIRNTKDEMAELWIDTHGGFRDIALIMEAIVSLLKVDSIIPEKIYGVKMGENIIVNQKAAFSVFEFVSGMNEFIDYGSVNILNRYYEGVDSTDIKKLLDAMNKVAMGTQECDTGIYEKGLNELGEALRNLKDNDSLLSIFKDYVESSYGNLLYPDKRSTIDIVKRCIDKGLVQQMLTFIESRMPEEFVKKRLVYCREGELSKRGLTQNERKNETYKVDANYIIDNFVAQRIDEKKYIKKILNGDIESRSTFMSDPDSDEKILYDRNAKKKFIVCTRLKHEKHAEGERLMHMHAALKKCRNKYNHCDPDRVSSEEIIKFTRKYIELAEELLKDKYYRENDPDEKIPIKKQPAEKRKEPADNRNEVYSFKGLKITGTKGGIRGVLMETQKSATLAKKKMKTKEVLLTEDLKRYISEEKIFKVKIIGKGVNPEEVLVEEV